MAEGTTKVCGRCRESKPTSDFYREKARRDGLHAWCKPCARAQAKTHYHRNLERYRAYNQRYREDFPERCIQSNEQKRVQWLKARFGMTLEQYQERLEAQGGVCALCARAEVAVTRDGKPRALSVDHDHSCCPDRGRSCGRCVRGLLCHSCNLSLGKFQDDPELLDRAAAYIRSHRA